MSEHEFGSDSWIDAKLRDVPTPVGLVARLAQIAAAPAAAPSSVGIESDLQFDASLAEVPLPPGLIQRLQDIPRQSGMHSRRVKLAKAHRREKNWALPQLALAASLLVAAGVFYLGWLSGQRAFERSGENVIATVPKVPAAKDDRVASNLDEADDRELPTVPFDRTAPFDEAGGVASPGNSSTPRENALVHQPTTVDTLPVVSPDPLEPIPGSISGPVFGAEGALDSLPELEAIRLAVSTGAAPPRVKGYDVLFQLRHGDHPFAAPDAAKELATLAAPLVTSTASYDAWKFAVRSGRLPLAESIRTEHFLAALDYNFPSPEGGALALRTAAGPSPAESGNLRMLQVGVQAQAVPLDHPATHLIVVLDASAAMSQGGGLELAKASIGELLDSLSSEDRLSLVSVGDRTGVPITQAGARDRAAIEAAVRAVKPGQKVNLVEGLSQAASLLQRDTQPAARRVVLITDGADLDSLDRGAAEKLLGELASASGKCDWLTVGDSQDDSDSETFKQLAQAGGGRFATCSSLSELRSGLVESLVDKSTVVASKASLKIVFNPLAVERYRLIGHEAKTLTAPEYSALEVDLRGGEAATALIELSLKASGGDDVATAELSWQDPKSGAKSQVRQRISRLQFAKSFAESPSSLQSAVLAAQTAEVLRGSYYAPSSRSLQQVLDLAGSLPSDARSNRSLQELLALATRTAELQGRPATSPVPAAAE